MNRSEISFRKNYTRDELIERLQMMGAAPKLLKMPAVIERILLRDCPNLDEIEVDANGNISYSSYTYDRGRINAKFNLQDDGSVRTQEEDALIDKYGMEKCAYGAYREVDKIQVLTLTGPADGFTDTYDNYPGWEARGVEFAEKEDFIPLIGHTILEYPETENWFVENRFLSPEKEERDSQIVEALQQTQERLEKQLQYEQEMLKREGIGQRDLTLDAMDASRGGVLESILSAVGPSREEKIKIMIKNIKLLEEAIGKCSSYIEIYSSGERPVLETDYTEEQAQKNRAEFFTRETERYIEEAQEIEAQNKSKAERLSSLQELAKRCSRIPFAGKKVASVLSNQMKLLQVGSDETEHIETETADEELSKAYKLYKEAQSRHDVAKRTSKRYSIIFKSLKDCILEYGKIPFVGKRILKEMEEITLDKSNDESKKTDEEER